jgi:hypothetical protein
MVMIETEPYFQLRHEPPRRSRLGERAQAPQTTDSFANSLVDIVKLKEDPLKCEKLNSLETPSKSKLKSFLADTQSIADRELAQRILEK